jgi:hypothetical protein
MSVNLQGGRHHMIHTRNEPTAHHEMAFVCMHTRDIFMCA